MIGGKRGDQLTTVTMRRGRLGEGGGGSGRGKNRRGGDFRLLSGAEIGAGGKGGECGRWRAHREI